MDDILAHPIHRERAVLGATGESAILEPACPLPQSLRQRALSQTLGRISAFDEMHVDLGDGNLQVEDHDSAVTSQECGA